MIFKCLSVVILPWMFIFLSGCASKNPPNRPHNLCHIFKDKPDWYRHAKKSKKRWNIPIAVMMAVMYQESSYRHDARPARNWFLFIPLPRNSSAYGYPQAQDGTWDEYKKNTGVWFASRSNYGDSIDFIGWYINKACRVNKISKHRADLAYLNYHEGLSGYRRGTYKKKRWLVKTATKVHKRAVQYHEQLKKCRLSD